MATTKRCKSGKRQFHSEKQAKRAITAAHQSVDHGYQRSDYVPQRAYKCPTCHRWHLTSQASLSPFPYDARRLVVRCLSMKAGTEAPTRFAAGWSRPGQRVAHDPKTFGSVREAVQYVRAELTSAYEVEVDRAGGVGFYTVERMAEALRSLDRLSDDDVDWSSGDALAGLVYWIKPVPVTTG